MGGCISRSGGGGARGAHPYTQTSFYSGTGEIFGGLSAFHHNALRSRACAYLKVCSKNFQIRFENYFMSAQLARPRVLVPVNVSKRATDA